MFEDITYDGIMDSMLSRVPDTLDKREGSIIYDALAPAAVEIMNLYQTMNIVMDETFADTATKEYLVRRCAERGIYMKSATESVVKAVFVPDTIDVSGKRFNCGAVNFIAAEKTEDGVYKLICETKGGIGNLYEGNLLPIDYIEGLESAVITELLIPGEEEEDTEDLRKRYFNSFVSQSFGGNVAEYKEKTLSIDGVGGVKVYPVWNGGGTVKLVIQDGTFGVPSSQLISAVQEDIDPQNGSGNGLGIAPIGHHVTVEGVTSSAVNISSVYTFSKNYIWDDVKENVAEAVKDYLKELNETWQDSENIVVRISQIESRILNVDGVLDIADTKINGAAKNYSVGENVVVTFGGVTNG